MASLRGDTSPSSPRGEKAEAHSGAIDVRTAVTRARLFRYLLVRTAATDALCTVHALFFSAQVADGLKTAPRAKLEAVILAAVAGEKLDMTDVQSIME